MEVLGIVQSFAVTALTIAGAVLLIGLTVALLILLPRLRRITDNLERTTESASLTAANTVIISQNFADRADRTAENLALATENLNSAMGCCAETTRNVASASRLLGPAGTLAHWASAARDRGPAILDAVLPELEQFRLGQRIRGVVDSVRGVLRR